MQAASARDDVLLEAEALIKDLKHDSEDLRRQVASLDAQLSSRVKDLQDARSQLAGHKQSSMVRVFCFPASRLEKHTGEYALLWVPVSLQ